MIKQYQSERTIPFTLKLIVGFILLLVTFAASLIFGAADTTLSDVWLALTSQQTGEGITTIRELRLPRELGAMFVGAALAVSGAIMQGMTRNPLADPGLLGLTAGANAALAITLAFIPTANYFGITIACFIGAAVGAFIVFGIASLKKGSLSPLRLVLAGAAMTAFLNAIAEGIGIYFKVSKDLSMWTAGGLIGTTWGQLQIIIPFICIGLILALLFSKQLTILSLSEEVSIGLGQNIKWIKAVLFVVTTLLAGVSVALVGNIAFLGLMIPHIVRGIVGTDYRYIIPMCALVGASFMMFADTMARVIGAPYETPIAALIAALGLPFFLMIVLKGGKTLS
ncbi:FecCD family ABC transporter permease [Paenibacillus agilis]|uniref:Iron ABC transporter permease n=1 Tax=Paenibacillus agilis TaxID=3020863 RepID=A0A559IPX7_9BACL|nr:iron ABC transporter permease [Paenibacillus agilis]TVX89691.1 iron ABC transporter permease [Paenibacillus agilis]